MATLAENLLSLNEAKQAIKTAIESKGQDLTGVSFTEYSKAIDKISGNGKENDIIDVVEFPSTVEDDKVYRRKTVESAKEIVCVLNGCIILWRDLWMMMLPLLSYHQIEVNSIYEVDEKDISFNFGGVSSTYIDTSTGIAYLFTLDDSDLSNLPVKTTIGNILFADTPDLEGKFDKGKISSSTQANEDGVYYLDGTIEMVEIGVPNRTGLSSFFEYKSVVTGVDDKGYDIIGHKWVSVSEHIADLELDSVFNRFATVESVDGVITVTDFDGDAMLDIFKPIKAVRVPSYVSALGYLAFGDASSIEYIEFSGNIISIDRAAFINCWALKIVDLTKCIAVPTLETEVFDDEATELQIKVPAALYEEWKTAENWSEYADKIVAVLVESE